MRLSGVDLWARIFLLLVVFVVIWICISSPDLKLHLYKNYSLNYSISQIETERLGPDQALHEEINKAENIPWSFSKFYNNTVFKYTNEEGKRLGLAMNCCRRPSIAGIKISNNYWQMAMTKDSLNSTDVFAYGAYVDTRLKGQTVIRIIINSHDYLYDRVRKPKFCQLWFPGIADPVISEVTTMDYMWWAGKPIGNNHPFLVACKLPETTLRNVLNYFIEKISIDKQGGRELKVFPESVSLVEEKCKKASNNLRINYQVPAKKSDFGVCVRWLDFPTQDLSLRLIEWIEMMTILGAGGIHFHLFAVHPNVLKVLKHYEKMGRITTKEFSLPGYLPNFSQMRHNYMYRNLNKITKYNYRIPMWRWEVTPYTDCFYTHLHIYKHIAAIDIDEIVLPVNATNWKDLFTKLKVSPLDTPCFPMVKFFENEIEPSMSKLPVYKLSLEKSVKRHVKGSPPYMMTQIHSPGKRQYNKCFHSTENVLRIYNHGPLECLRTRELQPCSFGVKANLAYVHHHRKVHNLKWAAYKKITEKIKFKTDLTILKYNQELISRRDITISNMNISS